MAATPFDGFQLSQLGSAQIQALKELKVQENESLDFKREFNPSNKGKKELCKDLSALANGGGGYLVVGVEEDEEARAKEIVPFDFSNEVDTQIMQVVADGISPRINGLSRHSIQMSDGKSVVIFHAPFDGYLHQVTLDGDDRIYVRLGSITRVMDPGQIANFHQRATAQSLQAVAEQNRAKLEEQLRMGGFHGVASNQGLISLFIAPLESQPPIDLGHLPHESALGLQPIHAFGWADEYHSDRIVTVARDPNGGEPYAATALFENGQIYACNSLMLRAEKVSWGIVKFPKDVKGYVPSVRYEEDIINAIFRYLSFAKKLGHRGPWFIGIGLHKIAGYIMAVDPARSHAGEGRILAQDNIIPTPSSLGLGQITSPGSIAQSLKKAFDEVWRAFGYPRSYNYNTQGQWSVSDFR